MVARSVTQTDHLGPWDLGKGVAGLVAEGFDGFADDLGHRPRARRKATSSSNLFFPRLTMSAISAADAMMSSSRLSSALVQTDHIVADVVVAVEERSGGHHVDGAAKQFTQCVFEPDDVEQRASGLELDEKVDVAVRGVLAACDRAEHRNRTRLVACRERDDLISVLLDK